MTRYKIFLQPFFQCLLIPSTPLFLGSLAVLLIISPTFLLHQYARLPSDLDGLSNLQRFELALPAVNYLDNFEIPETAVITLQSQTLPDGSPLYPPAELRHLIDVKHLTNTIRLINLVSLLCLLNILAYSILTNFHPGLYRAIGYGGLFTVLSFAALLSFVALFWPVFFVQFHELLFPPNTWTFSSTSGLIRLYPQLFWYRVGLAIIGRIVALGSVTTVTSFYLARRTEQKPPSPHPTLSLPFTLEQLDGWGNQRIAILAKRSSLVVLLAVLLFFSLRTYPFSLFTLPFAIFFSLPIFRAIKEDIAALSRYYHIQLRMEAVGTTGVLALLVGVTLLFALPSLINPDGLVYQGLLVALLMLFVYWVAVVSILIHRYQYPKVYPQE